MYQKYHIDEQFNFQINRFIEPFYQDEEVQAEVYAASRRISDVESWILVWIDLGEKAVLARHYALSSAYYQLADFFMGEDHPMKEQTYQLFKSNYYKSIDDSGIEFDQIQYENGKIPVAIIRQDGATKTLIFHGGFDSYLEELIRLVLTHCMGILKDYNFVLFEGPGQGMSLKSGLPMTYQWELPVKAILDYYNIEKADLIGMSLGGFLSMRAAVHKINNPIVAALVNRKILATTKSNIDMAFKIRKGNEVMNTDKPSNLIKAISKFTMSGIEDKITQEVLLLAGDHDMYVPTKAIESVAKSLKNAKSVTTYLFDQASGGERHCQVGNKQIAFDKISEFLS
ncbi:alpha/beta fold hydrolase [Leuconostoc gasicomitatum]|uniref:alpha/beta fold hydrolase n=1 Tax=Leuconostoc gasicomitatum TaxID=115778 RepID=UPI0007E0BA2D|nr:alpha/beta hydrolase [Leuconostoc gasicomitatum]CUW06071.1 Alpha/beta superfamily hydrolase [Leuconostoc gasicomitatum]